VFEIYLHVPLWQWIVSQVFIAVLIVVNFIGWQEKDNNKLLWWQVVFNLIAATANTFLFNWIAVAVGTVGALRQLSFIWVNKRKKKALGDQVAEKQAHNLSIIILVVFSIINVTTLYLAMENAYGYVIIATRLIVNWAMWTGDLHKNKIVTGIIWSSVMIVNAAMFLNIVGVVQYSMIIASIVIFYIRRRKSKIAEAS